VTAPAKLAASFRTITGAPSSPWTPTDVETIGFPTASASSIFTLTPPPIRSGQTTTSARA
jgi:hypothetical protein